MENVTKGASESSEPTAEIKEISAIYSNYVLLFGGDACQNLEWMTGLLVCWKCGG